MDNPEVILEYIKLVRKETRVTLTMDDIPEAPEGSVYKPSRKGKQTSFESEKVVQKPPKRKVVQLIEKEVDEDDASSY